MSVIRTIRVEELEAYQDLYNGLMEANENGTGYSPKVADAMRRLKKIPDGSTPLATPDTSRDLRYSTGSQPGAVP